MRIFIGLADAASYLAGLKLGFDLLGVQADYLVPSNNPFHRQPEGYRNNFIFRWVHSAAIGLNRSTNNHFLRLWWRLIWFLSRLCALLWAIFWYDVFIFGYKTTFLTFRDLPLLKLLGKKIIFVFLGSDERPPYLSGAYMSPSTTLSIEAVAQLTKQQKTEIQIIERYADICVSHPLSAQFHERPCVSLTILGFPFKPPATVQELVSKVGSVAASTTRPVRIIHAPSRPEPKGTFEIRETIERLRQRGLAIEYIELINLPNTKVLEEIANCDLVIDELYSDAALAGIGTEAANFGKPALVGGYARNELEKIAAINHMPLGHYVHPEQLEPTLLAWIVDEDLRLRLGREAKQFIEQYWTPIQVAKRYLQVIEGSMPHEWMFDPTQVNYVYGWGLTEERLASILQQMVDQVGPRALQVHDKPQLEQQMIKLAQRGSIVTRSQ